MTFFNGPFPPSTEFKPDLIVTARRVPWFFGGGAARRFGFSLAALPLVSRGGSAAKKVPRAQESRQLRKLVRSEGFMVSSCQYSSCTVSPTPAQ